MKKFLKKIKNFKYKHPQIFIVLLFLTLNIVILAVYSIIISIIENISLAKGFVYVLTVACMPDKLFDFDGGWEDSHFVQLTLMICETILFSGTIIGFVTNLFSDVLDKNSNAKGKIDFENHFLFLNWSKIAPNLIYDLSFSEAKYDIIILANHDREEILNSIESVFILNKRKHTNLNIIVKEGDPFSIKNLEDCSISKSKSISILTIDDTEGIDDFNGITDRGIYSLKLLMTVAPLTTKKTNIVVEVDTEKCVQKIKQLTKHSKQLSERTISVFSYNSILGQIMGKILINPLYSKAFYEILSFEGCEFYSIPNTSIETVLEKNNNCIPIVAYDDDHNGTIDQVYVLASEKSNVFAPKFLRDTPYKTTKKLNYILNKDPDESHLLIIGDAAKVDCIIQQINDYNSMYGTKIHCYQESLNANIIEAVQKLKEKTGPKRMIITSDESTDENSIDANIYLALLEMQSKEDLVKDIEIFTEILNPANYESTSNFDVNCVVISRKFISLIIIQLLTHPESLNFYNDLITVNNNENEGSFDIEIMKAKEVLEFDSVLKFNSKAELINSFYYSSDKKRLLIGISNDNQNIQFLCDNIDNPLEITLEKETSLVLINLS